MVSRSEKTYEVWHPVPRYDRWLETLDIPIYHEYFVDDLRTLRLGPWEERECNAAIVVFTGQEGVSEARVSEIPPGGKLRPFKFTLDEFVYVLEGRGLTTVWAGEGSRRKTFEWQKHSLFVLPRGYQHQLSNAQGSQPARLLHYNCLPLVMAVIPNPQFFFNNPSIQPDRDIFDPDDENLFSEAKLTDEGGRRSAYWVGNFFPDLKAWDKLQPQRGRGGGAAAASLMFPGTGTRVSLPTMPVGTYKKAHRHGAGIVIVIPGAEGMSVMWPEGKEKQFFVWHEGSAFVPPNQWYHQHFNLCATPARYIAMFPPRHQLFGGYRGEVQVDDPRRQIEYTEEDPGIRRRFEEELRKRGLKSRMPSECYVDPNYQWDYPRGGGD